MAVMSVTIASLDDPTPFAPERAIWIEDRLPWVVIDPGLTEPDREEEGIFGGMAP